MRRPTISSASPHKLEAYRPLMRRWTNAAAYLILIACLAALLFFGLRTFLLRLETGDSFPEYSTYRADPKGLKALYDSLQATEVVGVARRLQSSKILPSGEARALVVAGVGADQLTASNEDAQLFDHWLATGGRLIIALRPERTRESDSDSGERAKLETVETPAISWRSLIRRWGVELAPLEGFHPTSVNSRQFGQISRWFGGNYFDHLAPEWKVIAAQGKRAVIVERPFARGSLVLLSDSYPLSNEALAVDRNTGFLLWSISGCREVLFEETHLGLSERPGVMTLALRYGLQGTLISIVANLFLFIWKSQYTLLPRIKTEQDIPGVRGYSSEQAFLNLLRRTIPQKKLLGVCIENFLKTARLTPAQLAGLARFRSESNDAKPIVERYNRLMTLLNEKL
jgi:hypothetical protein